jgi:hypothetical protein
MPQLKDMSEDQLEKSARAEGWVPEDEFVGDPPRGGFKSAYQFLKAADDILPVVRSQNKKLKKEIDEMKAELKQVSSDAVAANEILQRQIVHEQKEKERLLREAEAKRATAITEGDGEAAVMAEREIHQIRQTPTGYDTQNQQDMVNSWMADNEWFNHNEVMRQWAKGYSDEIRGNGVAPGLPTLAKVAEKARQLFPDYFSSKEGVVPEPGDLTSTGRVSNVIGKRSFEDLPETAQQDYYRFKKLIPGFTQKQFLSEYEWDDA